MAKAKYVITAEDLKHVAWYLTTAERAGRLEFQGERSEEARRNFADYLHYGVTKRPTSELAAKLHAWCTDYLCPDDWSKLKTAVRKRRQRAESVTHTLSISDSVYSKLKRVASRDHVTYEEVLDKLLSDALRSTRPIKKKVTK